MRRWTTSALAVVLLITAAGAASADPVLLETWTYSPLANQLVVDGGPPFSIQGGTTSYAILGAPAVRFTRAPSLAIQTSDAFVAPGTADFSYRAVMSVDDLWPDSSANVFQYGRYGTHQVKLQLTASGRAQCVLRGTGGRVVVTSTAPSLDDGGLRHTFSCWREGRAVGVTLDGRSTSRDFALGSVEPTGLATAGNKAPTGDATDQLFGRIWSVGVKLD